MFGPSGRFGRAPQLAEGWRAAVGDHVIALAWSPDGSALAVAGAGGLVQTLDTASGAVRCSPAAHRVGATAVAWLDDAAFASAGQDGRVRVFDARTEAERLALDAGAKWVGALAAAPEGRLLASAAGKVVRLWDRSGTLVRAYPAHASTVSDLAWRPGTGELTSAAYGGVTRWSPEADEPVGRLEWKGSVLVMAWSPDGQFLATGDQDATVHFWMAATDTDLKMFGFPAKVTALAWDAGSRFLATGGGHRVTVWDCAGRGPEGTRPAVLDAHDERTKVSALAYQHRGPLLASGAGDGRVALWHPGPGRRPLAVVELGGGITKLAWAGDDARLAAGTEHGTVAVFHLS